MEEIRNDLAPRLIRTLRKNYGMTLAEFQKALNERVGLPGPGDVTKGSNWESLRKGRRQLPAVCMQKAIIQMHVEHGANSAHRKDYGFPFASWVEIFRNMYFSNDIETLRPLLDREIELGPRAGEEVHPDNWPYLCSLRGKVAAVQDNNPLEAIEWFEEADSMIIQSATLKDQIQMNLVGALFNDLRGNKTLTSEDVKAKLNHCEDICRNALRTNPKEHDFHRNLLRVLSRQDDETAFAEEFEDFVLRTDKDKLERLIKNDSDHDFANARRYACVQRFLSRRMPKEVTYRAQGERGGASASLLSVILIAALIVFTPISSKLNAEFFGDKALVSAGKGWEFGDKALASAGKGWEFGKILINEDNSEIT